MTRTCDLLVRSQTLYPTELRARAVRLFEVTTATACSPIRKGLAQFLPTGAHTNASLVIRHALARVTPNPARVDPVRHPHAGESTRGELRAEERLHRFRMRAASKQLPRILGVLPGGHRHHPLSYRRANPAQEAVHRQHFLDDPLRVLLHCLNLLG